MRAIALAACAVALLASSGCGSERTRLGLRFPDGARPGASSLRVQVWPASASVCSDLVTWRTGDGCEVQPCPAYEPAAEDLQQQEEYPLGDDPLRVDLALAGQGSWTVLVVAGNATTVEETPADARLYGCATLSSGDDAEVQLWRPPCAAEACRTPPAHPLCPQDPDCNAVVGATDDELAAGIPCSPPAETTREYGWAQDGEPCAPPEADDEAVLCRVESVDCFPDGGAEIVRDGVCPDPTMEERCIGDMEDYDAEGDFDCDGSHPHCDCPAGEPVTCGSGGCATEVTCDDDGTAECSFDPRQERCNGMDDNCDGVVDGAAALNNNVGCNYGRIRPTQRADDCVDGDCLCGSGPACGPQEACCTPPDGSTTRECFALRTSRFHCGGCGNDCRGDTVCRAGRCVELSPDGGVADAGVDGGASCSVDECNVARDPDLPRADRCADGMCRCGTGAPCDDAKHACCGGECVDITRNETCGGCTDEHDCRPDGKCTAICEEAGGCIFRCIGV